MVKELYNKLKYEEDVKKATEIIKEILNNKEEASAFFENELKGAISNYKKEINDKDERLFEIVFMLYEFDRIDLLEVILETLTFDDDFIEEKFGDILFDEGWKIFARLGRNNPEKLIKFIQDKEINIYCRVLVARALPYISENNEELKIRIKNVFKSMLNDKNEVVEFKYLLLESVSELGAKDLIRDCKRVLKEIHREEEIVDYTFDNLQKKVDFHLWDVYEKIENLQNIATEKMFVELLKLQRMEELEEEMGNHYDYLFEEQRFRIKVGRNEFCPCDSGKKYKKCCGKNNKGKDK